MKQNTVANLDVILASARPLTEDEIAVATSHVVANDLGLSQIVHDDAHRVEHDGSMLYSVEDFEPHALINPEYGVWFLETSSGRVYAHDWNSKAATLPAEIKQLVGDEHLSSIEVIEVFVENILPHLDIDDEECPTYDFDLIDEIKAMFSF